MIMAKRKTSRSRSSSSISMSDMKSHVKACQSCESSCRCKAWAWLLALVAVLFVAQDMGWLAQWGWNMRLNWWTVGFVLIAVKSLLRSHR